MFICNLLFFLIKWYNAIYLRTAFIKSYRSVFFFHPFLFALKYSLISFLFLFWPIWPRSMLFNLYIFVNCPIFLPLLIYSFTFYDQNRYWYDFNLLKFPKICFAAYPIKCSEECYVCTWEECVFCCCWLGCSIIVCLGPFVLKYDSSPAFLYSSSVWVIYPLLKIGYWSPLLLHCCLFSFLHLLVFV